MKGLLQTLQQAFHSVSDLVTRSRSPGGHEPPQPVDFIFLNADVPKISCPQKVFELSFAIGFEMGRIDDLQKQISYAAGQVSVAPVRDHNSACGL